jgi:hypothetical protein
LPRYTSTFTQVVIQQAKTKLPQFHFDCSSYKYQVHSKS